MGQTQRRPVAVLMGGHASEHAISLWSGRCMLQGLLEAGHPVHPVVIGTDGCWNLLPRVPPQAPPPVLPETASGPLPEAAASGGALEVTRRLLEAAVDTVVLGLHGPQGEDGSIQGFLDTVGLRYATSGVAASALCLDKIAFKRVLQAAGLPTPAFAAVLPGGAAGGLRAIPEAVQSLGLPLVIKPAGLGSSVGISVVREEAEARDALLGVLASGRPALAEAFVEGRELTGAVLGTPDAPLSFPAVEIVPCRAAWFDAASKYEPGGARELVPAPVPAAVEEGVRRLAAAVHALVDARGTTRTDFILDPRGRLWILEANTLPGMTEASLYPKAARAAGWTLAGLMARLVEDAGAGPPSGARSSP